MAIVEAQAWVSVTAAGAVSSATATYGSTPTQGNLLIACGRTSVGSFANASLAGWTLIAQTFCTSPSVSPFAIWYKIAGASESANVTLNWTGATNIMLSIGEYSGMIASPFDKSNSVASDGSSSTTKLSSNSPATSYPYELCVAVIGTGGGVGTMTWSNSFVHRITSPSQPNLIVATRVVYQKGIYGTTLSHTISRAGGGIIATFAGKDQHGLLGML